MWIVGTTLLVAVFPLIVEVEREQLVIENEKLKVADLQNQGYTLNQIQQMGYSIPNDPPVLSAE